MIRIVLPWWRDHRFVILGWGQSRGWVGVRVGGWAGGRVNAVVQGPPPPPHGASQPWGRLGRLPAFIQSLKCLARARSTEFLQKTGLYDSGLLDPRVHTAQTSAWVGAQLYHSEVGGWVGGWVPDATNRREATRAECLTMAIQHEEEQWRCANNSPRLAWPAGRPNLPTVPLH